MEIIENSNIVNWEDYPDFICVVVASTAVDLQTNKGVLPKGEELIILLDKAPKISDGDIELFCTKMCSLTGVSLPNSGFVPADIHEVHYKPKPQCNIHNKLELCV